MEKRKKWQSFLIVALVALTLYNILPTLFYYSKPLKNPISKVQADKIADQIASRSEKLGVESKDWIRSFCSLVQVTPQSITADGSNWVVRFAKTDEASRFRNYLPRAGSLISFPPAQLSVAPPSDDVKEVVVARRIPLKLEKNHFQYAAKGSPLYRKTVIDRAAQITYALAGPSEASHAIASEDPRYLESLAFQINAIADLSKVNKTVSNRLAANFTQGAFTNKANAIKSLIASFERARDHIKKNPNLASKEPLLIKAENFLKKHQSLFSAGETPWTLSEIKERLENSNTLSLKNHNPLFSSISIDWESGQIALHLQPDVDREEFKQPLINEAAKIARYTGELIDVDRSSYHISLHSLADVSGLLVLDLEQIGKIQAEEIFSKISRTWNPKHPDLQSLTIANAEAFEALSPDKKALSLTVHAPSQENQGLKVIAKGMDYIAQLHAEFQDSEQANLVNADFQSLASLLEQSGLSAYRGTGGDLVFEKRDTFQSLLGSTREDFQVKGTQKYAFLELSNLEHRILTENRIDTKIHEDLLKWKDEYNAAQVNIHQNARFDIPKPTQSVLLNNLALTLTKYFRGDEKRVIKWGLDLSGGKTVQLELKDANNNIVKNDEDIKQGINELYNRVNKMGVSEVAIRQLGHNIVLDFPGSQSLSASELIKASSMYFHIVNEKFSSHTSPISAAAQRFLQEIWNEAVVTNQKSAENINQIAYNHLNSDHPTDAARTLLDHGLLLQLPSETKSDSTLDDTLSKIAVIRGEQNQWLGQSHPLLFVFSNYTLEGSQLSSVSPGYDPQKGNYLSFEVASSAIDHNGNKISPRNILQEWTSRYSREKVAGTPLEEVSKARGWRMAVVLNDSVISSPTLDAVIRDSATISGQFSQREVNKLVSDLKAGSLSFTPHILSKKNVSPELGAKDRTQGIIATITAMVLVVIAMISYYRFAGLVASVAVLFNLLILWATLQNIGATLSLAGIAGIILTVGMAVDANVLVFERIKEEFSHTKKISSAISAGYKKAYSAIVDSNVTTIIAALILLNFDAGPIKGFAITLIIGIVSSMFTALFVTRYYFTGWVQNPKHTALNMANWIKAKSIDFLKRTKLAFVLAALTIALGSYFVTSHKSTIFGMDFTGGYSLYLEMEPKENTNYLQAVEKALSTQGVSNADFQVRELSPTNHLRILFGTSMELPDKPFYNMPLANDDHTNPRIEWVVESLKADGLALSDKAKGQLEANWTAMSGQMSDSMRNNALIGLLISFICIFIYISIRFEYKFAAAAIICLLHDVFITLGFMGILHALGLPVQIDLNTVAAIMTIVGYSLNDTIIIFDRIREEMYLMPKAPLKQVVNSAINATLSRTSITSGTTLLVLIALVVLGGSSIFSFALVMTIGVFFGTLSSWYIASPLMLFFHAKEEREPAKRSV